MCADDALRSLSAPVATIEHVFANSDCSHDSSDRFIDWLVLPDAQHGPSGGRQCCVGGAVAFDVPAELGRPVPLVSRGLATMLRADVPEAAVHEDRDLACGEHDVWPGLGAVGQAKEMVLSVPVPESVQGAAQGDFWFGVRPAIGLHVAGPAGV